MPVPGKIHPMRTFHRQLIRGGLLLGLGLAAGGCAANSAASGTTHMQDLDTAVQSSYETTHPDRLYYIGSEGQYDYYFLQNKNKRYRVPQSESLRDPRMGLTDDRSKWQVVSTGTGMPDSAD